MQAAAERQPEPPHVRARTVIYWAPLGTQFNLRNGAYRLFALARD